jgi:hypothetical protein
MASIYVGFKVDVTELASGFRVTVDAGDLGQCQVEAPRLWTALECAVPFMAGVALPDTPESLVEVDRLERLLRAASAPDGPPMGGGT